MSEPRVIKAENVRMHDGTVKGVNAETVREYITKRWAEFEQMDEGASLFTSRMMNTARRHELIMLAGALGISVDASAEPESTNEDQA